MEWRACARYPGYEVSEYGDVRRIQEPHRRKGGRLRGFIDCDGYLRYALTSPDGKTGVLAHRLVAEAFIGPAPTPKHEVAHNSGSRVSCYHRDLRWATRAENDADTNTHGTTRIGERNGRAKITEADVDFIRREYRRVKHDRVPGGLIALERRYRLHRATIIDIAMGRSWTHLPMPHV